MTSSWKISKVLKWSSACYPRIISNRPCLELAISQVYTAADTSLASGWAIQYSHQFWKDTVISQTFLLHSRFIIRASLWAACYRPIPQNLADFRFPRNARAPTLCFDLAPGFVQFSTQLYLNFRIDRCIILVAGQSLIDVLSRFGLSYY